MKRKKKTEIDILLKNSEIVMAVEVKSRPDLDDIPHHIKRLEILREYIDKDGQKRRKIQGAIAGAIFDIAVKKAVMEAGFYAIEQSGDTMKLDIPDGLCPGNGSGLDDAVPGLTFLHRGDRLFTSRD